MAYHTSKPASLQLTPQPLYGGLPLPASISAALNHAGTRKQAARDPPTPAAQNPLKSFEPVSPELFPLPCPALPVENTRKALGRACSHFFCLLISPGASLCVPDHAVGPLLSEPVNNRLSSKWPISWPHHT